MGLQMPERVHRQQGISGTRVPIVVMTAYVMAGDREKCLAAGMDDCISNPVGRHELAATIAATAISARVHPAIAPRWPQ
jgi:CheY-like chemotaxis protein